MNTYELASITGEFAFRLSQRQYGGRVSLVE
jgi:hypothetical protein